MTTRSGSLAVDLPGFGRSAPSGAAPGDWAASLLATAGAAADRPILVAHSLGTRYAVELAAQHPDRIAGLVLVSPYFLQRPPPLPLRRVGTALAVSPLIRRHHLAFSVGVDPAAPGDVMGGIDAWLRRPGARAWMARVMAESHGQRAHLGRLLARLTVPTTLVVGERDPLVVSTEGMAVQVLIVPSSGHNPQLDRPDLVAGAAAALHAAQRIADTTRDAYTLPDPITRSGKQTATTTGAATHMRP